MKVGDRVKFVGDPLDFKSEFRSKLKRAGEVQGPRWGEVFRADEVRVKWMPKGKRGYPEYSRHRISELELID